MRVRSSLPFGLVAATLTAVALAAGGGCVGDDPSAGSPPSDAAADDAPGATDAGGGDASSNPDAPGDAAPPIPKSAVSLDDVVAFSVPSGVNTVVPYTTALYDDKQEYDAAQHRFVAKHKGEYLVCASLNFPAASYCELFASRNGQLVGLALGGAPIAGCGVFALGAGEYLEVLVRQASGGALNVTANAIWNYLTISSIEGRALLADVAPVQLPSGAPTTVPYASEISDVANEYNPGTSKFTAAQAGDYQVCASLLLADYLDVCLAKSGTIDPCFASGTGGVERACRTQRLAAGDTLDVRATQYSGSDKPLAANPIWNWLDVAKVTGRTALDTINAFNASDGVNTRVAYANERYDEKGEFDTTNHRFVASEAGDYEVCASLTKVGVYFELYAYVNGTQENGLNAGDDVTRGCRVLRLKANDFVEVWVRQASGGAQDFTPGSTTFNWMTIDKLR